MMKRSVPVLACAAIGACLVQPAWGRQDRDTNRDRTAGQTSDVKAFRVSKLLGAQVQDQNGEEVGKIQELGVHTDSSKVVYAIVTTGGVLSGGGNETAVPIAAMRLTRDGDPVRLNIDQNRFKDAGEFDPSGWNNIGDPRWGRITHQFYGLEFDPADYGVRGQGDPAVENKLTLAKATELIGMDIDTRGKKASGEVEDLIFNDANDRITMAVVDFDNLANSDDKLFVVPFEEFHLKPNDNRLGLNVADDRLEGAPSFDSDQWPSLNDSRWNRDVVAYYGGKTDRNDNPSDRDRNRDRDADRDRDDEARTRTPEQAWSAATEYRRLYNDARVETINGRVESVETFQPLNHSQGVALRVKPDSGQAIMVHLGPAWFFNNQAIRFSEGDTVRVKGSRVEFQGEPAIICSEITLNSNVMEIRDTNGVPAWDVTNRNAARD